MTENPALVSFMDTLRISVHSPVGSRKKLLQEMAKLLSLNLEDTKERDIYHLLLNREKLGNTGIGNGVAIPHSRCHISNEAIIALITVAEPVDFDSIDGEPVRIAIGLLVPQECNQVHLDLLAEIARLMADRENIDAIYAATDAEQVKQLFSRWSSADQASA